MARAAAAREKFSIGAPGDPRAKLVLPPNAAMRSSPSLAVPELESRVTKLLGVDQTRALRRDLETIRRTLTASMDADELARERSYGRG